MMTGLAHDECFPSSFEHDLCPERSLLSYAFQIHEFSYLMNHTRFIFHLAEFAFSPHEPSYHLLLLISGGRWDGIHQYRVFVVFERNSSKRGNQRLSPFLSWNGDLKAGAHAVRCFDSGFEAFKDRCASGLIFGR